MMAIKNIPSAYRKRTGPTTGAGARLAEPSASGEAVRRALVEAISMSTGHTHLDLRKIRRVAI
jgi:hypothetical protein